MALYIMVEQWTGTVWGGARADTPVAACRKLDLALNGKAAVDYLDHPPSSRAMHGGSDGYFVYRAPDDFDVAKYGEVNGENPLLLAAVQTLPLAAFVEIDLGDEETEEGLEEDFEEEEEDDSGSPF
jgi:hypothetical protein